MKERPILFSGEMVRATLGGRKTQTRRVVKWPVKTRATLYRVKNARIGSSGMFNEHERPLVAPACPYGVAGDRLWVRETFARVHPGLLQHLDPDPDSPHWEILYRADELGGYLGRYKDAGVLKWRPSIFMPRALSRIALEIVGVRVERLHEISEDDAKAEGVNKWANVSRFDAIFGHGPRPEPHREGSYAFGFLQIWNRINGSGAWDKNPWVWVLEFKRIT